MWQKFLPVNLSVIFVTIHQCLIFLKTFQESFLADSFLSMVQYARDNEEATAAILLNSMVKQCDGKLEFLFKIPLESNVLSE